MDSDGLCDPTTRTIYVRCGMSESEKTSTILHELIHAIFFESGLHHTSVSEDLIEIICHAVSETIHEQFRVIKRKQKS
jgi:Zn-dependent peptidase ImmA (M78 family)